MSFHQYGETVVIPRNEHVDLHVREVTLAAETPTLRVECVEVREYLKEGEVYGNGLVIPTSLVGELKVALDRVAPKKAVTSA